MVENQIKKYSEDEVKRAAYALNMCTVSVSQIVDYNDIYILEQEYEAILNNLNLEKMPKDEALLKILVELLNTITFFRIQEKRKKMIEKQYQDRVKNAIWSAVPNLGLLVAGGNLKTLAVSIATQVGIGYMNYRKEKASALSDKEKSEVELQITALEQFNALRRELFTTAWRLADEYGFRDEYRLTERQIKQYNEILRDQNEIRKYERLETIQSKFQAYPPFWYFFGHAANMIATSDDTAYSEETKKYYQNKAKMHFQTYEGLSRFNVLREDQMCSSFALEYVDLLLLEENPDYGKVNQLLALAVEMSGNANDVLEMCMISYLKIGNYEEASKLLKVLINEDYNTSLNAKLLSRIYVSKFFGTADPSLKNEIIVQYDVLSGRVHDERILFPMPLMTEDDKELQAKYIQVQKCILRKEYNQAIQALIEKNAIQYHQIIPAPSKKEEKFDYYADTAAAKENRRQVVEKYLMGKGRQGYIELLQNVGYVSSYLDLMDKTVTSLEGLYLFQKSKNRDDLIEYIEDEILLRRPSLKRIQEKIEEGTFAIENYDYLENELSYTRVMKNFFEGLEKIVTREVDLLEGMNEIDEAEYDLIEFCRQEDLRITIEGETENGKEEEKCYTNRFSYLMEAETQVEAERKRRLDEMVKVIRNVHSQLLVNESEAKILYKGENEFSNYFDNICFDGNAIKPKVVAIIDDLTKKDADLLFCTDGFMLVEKNKIRSVGDYGCASLYRNGNVEMLKFATFVNYENKAIHVGKLYELFGELEGICN